jgi:hypothetical protein
MQQLDQVAVFERHLLQRGEERIEFLKAEILKERKKEGRKKERKKEGRKEGRKKKKKRLVP